MATVVADVKYKEGLQTITYSQEGWKAKRTFRVYDVEITPGSGNGYGSVYAAMQAAGIPQRGNDHPYLDGTGEKPLISADVISAKAVDPTTVDIEVDYALLNAMTQEPTWGATTSDTVPAFLTVASSLQSFQKAQDVAGNPLTVPYAISGGGTPSITIWPPNANEAMPGTGLNAPAITCKAQTQIPNLVLRFQRREQQLRSGAGLVGYYNSVDWTITQFTSSTIAPQYSLLCTRVENTTRDEGRSYIVTYEFQFAQNVILDNCIHQAPSTAVDAAPGVCSGWDVGLYYVLPNGVGKNSSLVPVLQPGQTPPDAIPTVFAVYGKVDFQTALSLC